MKLIHGDCLEEMKKIAGGSVDMVLTDPPYGTTACKWDSIIPLEPMWEQLKRVIKPNGAIVMTASQPFTTTLIASNMKMFKYCWVWDKRAFSNQLNAKKQPLKITEDIVVFNAKLYIPQGLLEVNKETNQGTTVTTGQSYTGINRGGKRNALYKQQYTNYPRNILVFSKDRPSTHPTQKPVALMEYLIKTYTNESETILDFAMGSGTTGVACKNLNRDFIGIELDEEYYEIAKNRIEHA